MNKRLKTGARVKLIEGSAYYDKGTAFHKDLGEWRVQWDEGDCVTHPEDALEVLYTEEELVDLVSQALVIDGAHHKQWYLERLADLLGIAHDDEESEETSWE